MTDSEKKILQQRVEARVCSLCIYSNTSGFLRPGATACFRDVKYVMNPVTGVVAPLNIKDCETERSRTLWFVPNRCGPHGKHFQLREDIRVPD